MNSPHPKPTTNDSQRIENDYRVALRHLRGFNQEAPQSYSQGLSGAPWSYAVEDAAEGGDEDESNLAAKSAQVLSGPVPEPAPVKSVTEKTKVLDSLQDFARTQLAKGEKESISFQGGEIRQRDIGAEFLGNFVPEVKDRNEIEELTAQLSEGFFKLKYSLSPTTPLKAMFIAECSQELSELEGKELGLEAFFDLSSAQLLDRMIQAMKLGKGDDVFVSSCYALKDGRRTSFEQSLVNEILYFRPQVVFSLGGATTSRLLGGNQRLQNCHGQFFEKEVSVGETVHKFEVMPLFSPAFLVEAPNSKRIAWEDMQKAMTKLGLNS